MVDSEQLFGHAGQQLGYGHVATHEREFLRSTLRLMSDLTSPPSAPSSVEHECHPPSPYVELRAFIVGAEQHIPLRRQAAALSCPCSASIDIEHESHPVPEAILRSFSNGRSATPTSSPYRCNTISVWVGVISGAVGADGGSSFLDGALFLDAEPERGCP